MDNLPDLVEAEFYGCSFKKINLPETSLRNSNFFECSFMNCNLSNADLLGSRFKEVVFKESKLVGINWCSSSGVNDLDFENCQLDLNVFQEMKLEGFKAVDSTLKEVDFSGCDLKNSAFCRSNLKAANFNQANLEKADFTSAEAYFIDPTLTRIKGAKFSMPEALTFFKALEIIID
jgi:uncharacterized protein YjbI with pentapeptide repeats